MRRAAPLLTLAAVAAVTGGTLADTRLLRARERQRRPKESIDDVLVRARSRRGKGAFDLMLDGRVKRG